MPKQKNDNKAPIHTAVMVQEVVEYLSPARGESYLDVTAGLGGHARAIAHAAGRLGHITLVDRDPKAVAALSSDWNDAEILHSDFLSASESLAAENRTFDLILADLGASSLHLDEAGRGFSFLRSGPLDMRMDSAQELTAEHLVNHASVEELGRIISRYGEERRAGIIAKSIVRNRPITDTLQLAEIVEQSSPRKFGSRIHPATKTFQALRIAVNDELHQLEQSLPLWVKLLAPGGRLAVISFHSLEDRLVKSYFAEHGGNRYDAELTILTKKPVTPKKNETVSNPRSRSAKLRVCSKIKTKT